MAAALQHHNSTSTGEKAQEQGIKVLAIDADP
jgi:hypothetical protein